MKKTILMTLLLISPLLTACGSSNKLTCKRDVDGATMEEVIEFDNNKEKATGMTIYYTVDFSSDEQIEEFGCEDLDECMKLAEEELEDCKRDSDFELCEISNKTKTSITIKGVMKQSSVEEELKNKNYEEVKKRKEEEEKYTCK